jgi:hypothetical protein
MKVAVNAWMIGILFGKEKYNLTIALYAKSMVWRYCFAAQQIVLKVKNGTEAT